MLEIYVIKKPQNKKCYKALHHVIDMAGFETATPCSQSRMD
tara:strand:+ start:259 stop:381 length:123 start_codon:yes stop_codon:yes gene_type:complete